MWNDGGNGMAGGTVPLGPGLGDTMRVRVSVMHFGPARARGANCLRNTLQMCSPLVGENHVPRMAGSSKKTRTDEVSTYKPRSTTQRLTVLGSETARDRESSRR